MLNRLILNKLGVLEQYYKYLNDPRSYGYSRAISNLDVTFSQIPVDISESDEVKLIEKYLDEGIYGVGEGIKSKILTWIAKEEVSQYLEAVKELSRIKQVENPHKHYTSRDEAREYVRFITDYLDSINVKWHLCGSYRRGKPIVGDLDIVVVSEVPILNDYLNALDSIEILAIGREKIKLKILNPEFEVDIRYCKEEYLGTMLLYFTGSANFNLRMRSFAKSKDLSLSEYGICKSDILLYTFNEEKQVFDFLGYPYVAPEDRS